MTKHSSTQRSLRFLLHRDLITYIHTDGALAQYKWQSSTDRPTYVNKIYVHMVQPALVCKAAGLLCYWYLVHILLLRRALSRCHQHTGLEYSTTQ